MAAEDISDIIARWPFDSSRIQARLLKRKDGSIVIQLRVDLGLLQMERDGRPDGSKPGEFPSLLERYRSLIEAEEERGGSPEGFRVPREDFQEIDRELLQYHHRRMALLSLGDHARAARDAEHCLDLLLTVRAHCRDRAYLAAHERSIPPAIMESARAKALMALKKENPRAAVLHIEEGVRLIHEHVQSTRPGAGEAAVKETAFLRRWARRLRRAHKLEPPLELQLEEAVQREDYEEAARLRDEIRRQSSPR